MRTHNSFESFPVHANVGFCFTNCASARQRRQAETHKSSLKISLHSLKLNSTLLVLREKMLKNYAYLKYLLSLTNTTIKIKSSRSLTIISITGEIYIANRDKNKGF